MYPLRATNCEKKGRVEDLEDRSIPPHDSQRPESTGLFVTGTRPPPASKKEVAAHITCPKDLSNYAVGLCGLSDADMVMQTRTHQFSQHLIKAPHEGWHGTVCQKKKKKSRTCLNQKKS